MTITIEKIILRNLVYLDEYTRKVLPFIKPEYFHDNSEKLVFEKINDYVTKYNSLPNIDAIKIAIEEAEKVRDNEKKVSLQIAEEIESKREIDPPNSEWLLTETEKFCQEKALHNAILKSIHILDKKEKNTSKSQLPSIISEALAVSFDTNVGHDYLESAEQRYDYYHQSFKRIPFDIENFNLITNGGFAQKTINIFVAGTNVGKTLVMAHLAANNLKDGYNVLYITLEISEEEIAKRIDENLMNISQDDLMNIKKENYINRISKLKNSTKGRLIVKEYPTGGAGALHFQALLNELNLKKEFVPDIIYIDYLNICSSSRLVSSSSSDSYGYIKAVGEELRGLGVKYKVPIVTATQTNRSGYMDSDFDLDKVADSFGTGMTADFVAAIISNEDLETLNQYQIKQLKNRYRDKSKNKRFYIGVDRDTQRLYNVEQSAQKDLYDSDKSRISTKQIETKSNTSKFGDFKI